MSGATIESIIETVIFIHVATTGGIPIENITEYVYRDYDPEVAGWHSGTNRVINRSKAKV